MSKPYFKEEQKFNQVWIWVLLIAMFGVWIWQLVQQVFMGIPFGNNPAPDFVVILLGLFPVGVVFLFRFLMLETLVDTEGIHYRFRPFQKKFKLIKPEDISRYEVKKYNPLMDYGGWGIRLGSTSKGTAYNVRGNQGVLFELKSGKKFLLGTQEPNSFRYAMEKLMKNVDNLK
jgi:hypothetical protein